MVRLEELRGAVTEDRIEAGLRLGGHRELVGELRELVAMHPLRERLLAQLMRALCGSGRQSEALEAYEEARGSPAQELGVDPGPELAAVHLAVLRGEAGSAAIVVSRETDPSAVSRETAPSRGSRETAVAPQGLPAQLSSFVGRAEELARIGGLLGGGARLVTLVGPGGAGKTRLAVEAAGRYEGEVCFVDLSAVDDGGEVPQALLGALGIREARLIPPSGPGRTPDPVARLCAALADRPLLLVLDNCEHVIVETAALVACLGRSCTQVKILATSREALRISGEMLCLVQPLPLPPSGTPAELTAGFPVLRLFAERAAAVRSDFDLGADLEAVLEICQALDGLPLAIELAAARLRSLSAAEIAGRLGADQRFRLLSRGSRTAQPRQQTLRGVVDWNWDLLPAPEQAVLRRASVFAGGWTLDAVEAVCADGARATGAAGIHADDVLELTESLVDKSLVVARPADGGGTRYRLLETIRAYAAERLGESGETARLRRAHAAYFLGLAVTAEPHLRRVGQLQWLRRLAADHDNLHTALRRSAADADSATGLRLTAALSTYWMLRGLRYEGAQSALQLLEHIGPAAPDGLGEEYVLTVVAAASATPDREELTAHLAAARAAFDELFAAPRRYPALVVLWAPFAGVPDRETYERYRAGFELVDNGPWYLALMHVGEGFQRWWVDAQAEESEREFTEALTVFRGLGDRWGMAMALTQLAWLADFRSDIPRAIDEALALDAALDATESIAELLCQRGECHTRAGDHEAAHADLQQATELARRAGAPEYLARAHMALGESARLRGDLTEARRLCELALEESSAGWFSGRGTRSSVLLALGRICAAEGRPGQSRAYYRQAFRPEHDARNLPFAAATAEAFAGLALIEGDPVGAAELLGTVRVLRGMDVLPGPDGARVTVAARAALGDQPYKAAYARGAALGLEQALQALAGAGTG
ncbi:ATP-binding protein [Actinacidiphila oryziradicis]|uniref:ATP-binding protein n=1 Tax=Actinacidiphila oryziradicis TaxID=2571141 RepID=UPI001FECF95C|nr:BTAD domain-containing putative transcriptional regulator [Actinacidiphila oryziradicis]